MRDLSFPHDEAVRLFGRQVSELQDAVGTLDDMQLLAPSLCAGWSVLDLVVHVRLGLQEMAIGTTSRTADPADRDAASYWTAHPGDRDDDPVPHILWLRRVASAYARPAGAVTHLRDAAASAVAAVQAMPEGVVAFQGQRLASGDFVAIWVVELAAHQLDLGPDAGASGGLGWTRRTLEAVADADLPADLDDRTAVLLGLGRVPAPPTVALPGAFPVSL